MWQHAKLSEQIRPWNTLACCWYVKQPTSKQTSQPSLWYAHGTHGTVRLLTTERKLFETVFWAPFVGTLLVPHFPIKPKGNCWAVFFQLHVNLAWILCMPVLCQVSLIYGITALNNSSLCHVDITPWLECLTCECFSAWQHCTYHITMHTSLWHVSVFQHDSTALTT